MAKALTKAESLELGFDNKANLRESTSELMLHLNGSRGKIKALKFHPILDKLVSGGADGKIHMWNINVKPKTHRNLGISFHGHTDSVNGIDISKTGENILSCSSDKSVRVWTTKSNGPVIHWVAHSASVRSCSLSPVDQKLVATCSNDRSIKLWALERLGTRTIKPMFKSSYIHHTHWVNSVRFSPDGQLLCSASDDKKVSVMDLRVKDPVAHRILDSTPTMAEFNPGPGADHFIGISTSTGNLLVVDTRMERMQREKECLVVQSYENIHKSSMTSFVTHCTGDFIFTVGADFQIKILDLVEGRRILTYFGHKEPLYAVASSDDGKFIATGGEGKEILVWRHRLRE